MNDLPDTLARLEARVETLEQRVYTLEHPAEAPSEITAKVACPPPGPVADEKPSATLAGGTFQVLGRAMLGIAGAYLLRAVAESSSLPKTAVAAVAIAYALGWLVWASRAKAGDWLASTTYACTSAMILAPMLWELTFRFNVLPATVSAAVVCGFVLAASALAWRRDLAPVMWVATFTGVAIALTLGIASHQILPFIAALLLMVLIGEYAAGRGRDSGVRVLVALAADAAIWALLYIYSSPEGTRADYPPLSSVALLTPGIGLFLIIGLSLLYKTVLRRKPITVFETIETMIAFLLAACGLVYFGAPSSATALGVFCVVLSVAGYAGAFVYFDAVQERRNCLVFASWSAALLLAGSLLCLPHGWQPVWLSVAAISASIASARMQRFALEVHGMLFLLVAAGTSGLLKEVFDALAGTLPGAPGMNVCVVSVGAVLCYAAIKPSREKSWIRQFFSIVFATLAIAALAALSVQGLEWLTALKVIPGAHHLAFIRTLTACVAAIALAYSGAHWRRMELTRIGYTALALLAVKLVVEDLRHGHLAFIAGSIFLFAITLIVVPRVARMGQGV
ncbi:MAG: hypothetical protein WA802_08425 [Terracidiphilus sp.]